MQQARMRQVRDRKEPERQRVVRGHIERAWRRGWPGALFLGIACLVGYDVLVSMKDRLPAERLAPNVATLLAAVAGAVLTRRTG